MASEPTFKEKIISVFGMGGEEEPYNDNDGYYDDAGSDAEGADYDEENGGRRGHHDFAGIAGAEVLIVEPELLNDAPIIVNKIKENKTVVVNLRKSENEDGGRILDFLNGAVFALEGSVKKIAEQVFILAPPQVSVSTKMDRHDDDMISPVLEWDQNL